jgi:hypothetical protein
MLLEEFLIPMNITQRRLADAIQVPYQRINRTPVSLQLFFKGILGTALEKINVSGRLAAQRSVNTADFTGLPRRCPPRNYRQCVR